MIAENRTHHLLNTLEKKGGNLLAYPVSAD